MFLDRLAGWWLDWRTDRAARRDPRFAEFGLHKFSSDGKSLELVIATETVAILADQAATMLKENDAENFIQLDMMPRLDRMMRPVRVTVQWANGISPAEKCAKLERKCDLLSAAIDALIVQAIEITPGWVSIPEVEWSQVIDRLPSAKRNVPA